MSSLPSGASTAHGLPQPKHPVRPTHKSALSASRPPRDTSLRMHTAQTTSHHPHPDAPSSVHVPRRPFEFRAKPPTPGAQPISTGSSPSSVSSSALPISAPAVSGSFRFYQPPKNLVTAQSDENDSDDDSSRALDAGSKLSKACAHCKSLKVKCFFADGQAICQRCQFGNHDCVVGGRKKRRMVATHDELREKAYKQDREIEALLKQIDKLTADKRIESWLTRAQSHDSISSSHGSDASRLYYPTNERRTPYDVQYNSSQGTAQPITDADYFSVEPRSQRPAHMRRDVKEQLLSYFPLDPSVTQNELRHLTAPDIITTGLIAPDEIPTLFKTFFELINPYFSILDPELHTPAKTIWKCHFLFTVICALACRFYTYRQNGLYESALEFARDAAGKALTQGAKTVDTCQAYLLLAVYPKPKKKWVDDRSWLLMGVAFSLATELNLHHPSPDELDERERLNRRRTWLNCFCVDASHATQFGKLAMLSVDDYVARTSREWYCSSKLSVSTDVHLVAYVEVLRTMGRFRKERAMHGKLDYRQITEQYNAELVRLCHEWTRRFDEHPQRNAYMFAYRAITHRMNNTYSRLVVMSFGFQKAVKEGVSRDDIIVQQCKTTAQEVISYMTQELFPTGMLRYSMEAHFLFVSFAASFLLNLLTPDLSVLLCPGEADTITELVQELIRVLRSRKVVLDGRHTPYLYARFLSAFLNKYTSTSPEDITPTACRPNPTLGDITGHSQASYDTQAWHDGPGIYDLQTDAQNDADIERMIYQHANGPEMDFSMTNFVQTLSSQPNFLDASPPPGADTHIWWTEVYPANNGTLPDGFQWPMTVDSQTWWPEQQPVANDINFVPDQYPLSQS